MRWRTSYQKLKFEKEVLEAQMKRMKVLEENLRWVQKEMSRIAKIGDDDPTSEKETQNFNKMKNEIRDLPYILHSKYLNELSDQKK